MRRVYVVSDGEGGTAVRALRAALVQFPAVEVEIEVHSRVRTESQVNEVIAEVAREDAFIVHTLVTNELRECMLRMGRLHNVETIDLMGPLLDRLSRHLTISPTEEPGLLRQLNEEYFRRIETMEFAFRHDDGMRVSELGQAEIVVIGVSRTFKTPLCIYFAFKGWLAANVPIVLGINPPRILFQLPPERIFALTTDPRRLAALRRVREKYLGMGRGEYASIAHVRRELAYAHAIFEDNPDWAVIDVTAKPIEEIAAEIFALAKRPGTSDQPETAASPPPGGLL